MSTAIADSAIEARTLINRDYISYSAISTYQRCPLSFFFRYVEQLPEETVAAALVFGSAIHSAAEFHFNELMAGSAFGNSALSMRSPIKANATKCSAKRSLASRVSSTKTITSTIRSEENIATSRSGS